LIAKKVTAVMGASEDASRVYFVSSEALPSEPNSQGKSPLAGKTNLYLHESLPEEGARLAFAGTLATADTVGKLSSLYVEPFRHTARVSPNGRQAVFMSTASLTGYDNTDVGSGKADAEVFLFSDDGEGAGELSCVSCNPTGARPTGRELELEGGLAGVWAAASIPGYDSHLYGSRVLSGDGNRVFFTGFEPLAYGDTNGKADVYQWEKLGTGGADGCNEEDIRFDPASGGCLSLISSGQSPTDAEYVDSSADGADVFIATDTSLVSQDPGLIDIYDARIGGGFPPPPPPPACEGEACQGPASAPNDPTPASSSFRGPGDPSSRPAKPRCGKGKRRVTRRGKVRCVAKNHQKHRLRRGKD
jgi:hypothetical protein